MPKKEQGPYERVSAFPVKAFFVHMLTRDIRLEDAILDLLDNCVDGILRTKITRTADGKKPVRPYTGFWAEIKFDKATFSIADNCGGIPWKAHEYAFRIGRAADRPVDPLGSVGAYGVGMKRAIFKMGSRCLITTRNGADAYEVEVPEGWVDDEKDWSFPVQAAKKPMAHDGTTLVVGSLDPSIAARFSLDAQDFQAKLDTMVATHYAFIINKGFQVKINDHPVRPRSTKILSSLATKDTRRKPTSTRIQPFLFRAKTEENVEIFLAVGFTRPIPSSDEVEDEQEKKRYASEDAGWTIICNDRAVVYCDRTELTGWGEAGVPRYHTQFIAISGIVEFKGDASKLPTTTTKRDVDASSALYLQVKNKMREGMRIFTDYTNKWKKRADESKEYIEAGTPLTLEEIKSESSHLEFKKTTTSVSSGEQYKPQLPMPKRLEPTRRRICFVKSIDEIEDVSEHLLGESDADPSTVGETCFDMFLKEARSSR
jgi:hypothetical protein